MQHSSLFLAMLRAMTVILALLLAGMASATAAMRCGSRIIDREALAAELLSACGEPSFRDQLLVQSPNGTYVADTEIWTYDFGPQKLLQLVTLRNGQISEIEADGYGFSRAGVGRCEPRRLVAGLSKYRLVAQCGEPLTKRSESLLKPLERRHEIYQQGNGAYAYQPRFVSPVYREEWVYNFGSRSPMRRVILEDGRVTNVESIDRGFDR